MTHQRFKNKGKIVILFVNRSLTFSRSKAVKNITNNDQKQELRHRKHPRKDESTSTFVTENTRGHTNHPRELKCRSRTVNDFVFADHASFC